MNGDRQDLTQGDELLAANGKGGKALRIGAVIVWCAAMGGLLHALVDLSNPRDRKGEKVAYLSIQHGNVKFRPSESILWVDAAMDQAFHDGDTVVTEGNSRAVIRIGKGQEIELGENSMVGLDMKDLSGKVANGVNLTLYKGNLVAIAKPNVKKDPLSSILSKIGFSEFGLNSHKVADDAPIKVKSGTKEVVLPAAGKAVVTTPSPAPVKAVAKAEPLPPPVKPAAFLIDLAPAKPAEVKAPPPPPKAIAVVKAPPKPVGPTPEELAKLAADKAAADAAAAAQARLAAEKAAEKAAAAAAALAARSMGPSLDLAEPIPPLAMVPIVSPNQSLTLYTGESLRGGSCASDDVTIFVEPPKLKGQKPSAWVPFLDVASAADPTNKFRVYGAKSAFVKQGIKIPARDVCGLARNPNAVGIALNMTPGVVFRLGGPDTAAPATSRLFLGSVADFPSMPVTVYLTKVAKGSFSRKGWVAQGTTPAALQAGAYAVELKTAQDLPVMFDLIAASGAFTYNNAPVSGMAEQVHLAANGVILATVGAPSYKKNEIRKLASTLDANVAFTGRQSDLIALPKAGVNRIGVLENALSKNGQIKVMSRNRIVVVNKEDVQFSGDQLKVLARNASSAFKPDANVVVP